MRALDAFGRRPSNRGRIDIASPDAVHVVKHTYNGKRRSVWVTVECAGIDVSIAVDAPDLIDGLLDAEKWRTK